MSSRKNEKENFKVYNVFIFELLKLNRIFVHTNFGYTISIF